MSHLERIQAIKTIMRTVDEARQKCFELPLPQYPDGTRVAQPNVDLCAAHLNITLKELSLLGEVLQRYDFIDTRERANEMKEFEA